MSVTVIEAGDDTAAGSSEVAIPAVPWRFDDTGQLVTVPQGSASELAQSVQLALMTRASDGRGERRSEPEYGTTDWRFMQRLNPADVEQELETVEPRATVTVTVETHGARNDVTVTVAAQEA